MSQDEVTKQVEDFKSDGNKHFQASNFGQAIASYTKGLDACKLGIIDPNLKATILSNRAACYLSAGILEKSVDDCTEAIALVKDDAIRSKILYRRAKAWFLLTETPNGTKTMLQDAAKDLMQLLSFDPKNGPAAALLRTIRAKHDLTKGTPISQTLDSLREASGEEDRTKQFNILLGLLANDEKSAPLELGRRGGVAMMLDYSCPKALQVITVAASNPKFVHEYGKDITQARLAEWMQGDCDKDLRMGCLSVWLRLVLYLDPLDSQETVSLIDDNLLLQSCISAFSTYTLLPAALDVLSSWTAINRQTVVMGSTTEPVLHKYSESELRRMKPRDVAAIRKIEYQLLKRDKEWAKRRATFFCVQGGLERLLQATVVAENHGLRKQVGVVLGRILLSIQDDEDVKDAVNPLLGGGRFRIEEVDDSKEEKETDRTRLVNLMMRSQLVSSLLLGQADVGACALDQIRDELRDLIHSDEANAMAIASELVSAAASVEKARPTISSMFSSGAFEPLLEHPDQNVRSGAASAVAKLGMADKNLDSNEGDVMELLQIASELLYEDETVGSTSDLISKNFVVTNQAATSVERGIEVIGYLSSKTQVKEELAHGFKSHIGAKQSTLERLVELSNAANAGESISAYALATTFSLIAVSNETLRREAFAGKEITMEQYDELQAIGKTEEEKEAMHKAVEERIRRLALVNVPRAMIKLMDGASEATLERLAIGMNRMATEPSVRGLLIQQGVLSSCIKVEDVENASQAKTNSLREARNCIARLLVTTNPSVLTTSQRIGAIKPLIYLIRDSAASNLQHFEALLAVTNLAASGNDAKEKIVSEKGISTLSYAMFSDHEMIRRAATEAMCNLVPHPAMVKYLADPENLRLWLAFAADQESNFECARAASGCLAMSTDIPEVALAMVGLKQFKESMTSLLESGNLELMHRVLVVIQNLLDQGGECREKVVSAGLVAFCRAYVDSYHDGSLASSLGFTPEQQELMSVTVDLAKAIINTT
jgi:protein unc-45